MTRSGRTRWITAVGLAALLTLLFAPGAQAAQRTTKKAAHTPRSAPLNPRFVLWQAMSGLEPVLKAASPHGLGLRPSPTIGYVTNGTPAKAGALGAFPVSFDLRGTSKLTAVRNQGSLGTCWTFASMGSLESSTLPGESLDLAEDNMALQSGFNIGGATTPAQKYNTGGNLDMATAYLARWGGPVLESDDTYGDSTTPAGLTARRHVQNIDFYEGRTSATDNDRIKYAISTYGATYVSMCWDDSSYSSANKSHYYTGTDDTNHAVAVVGWNDDYPASNFSTAAPGNGAFIVRNSWGSNWGTSGYFYVSYYDSRFARAYSGNPNYAATFEAAQPASNYSQAYQYDPLGAVSAMGMGSTTAWGANKFTASASGTLTGVGFYVNAPGTAYEVWEGVSTSSLTRLTSGSIAQMGYHTVTVPGATLTNGAAFVVAVKLTTPGYDWPLAIEYPMADYSSAATASSGQSYYSSNGTSWTDLTSYRTNANACIKAFASSGPVSSCSYGFAANGTSSWKTAAQTVTITAAGGSGTGRTIHYSLDGGGSWATSATASVDVPVAGDGSHHVEYYVSDSSGTEATHDAGWVNIDTVAPATTDDHPTVAALGPVTVTLSPADATSGMSGGHAKTEYKVDGAAQYASGAGVVLGAGTHTVAYRSTDAAGNVESPDKTFSVTVIEPPTTQLASPASLAPDAGSGWRNSGLTFTIAASGGMGNGLTIHYTVDGGATWSTSDQASVSVTVSSDGAHHVKYYAGDSLSTEAEHDSGWINIDTAKPLTTASRAKVRRGAKVTLKFRVADAIPGCGSATVKLQIRKRTKVVKTIAVGTRATNVAAAYRYKAKLKPGTYTYRMLATDAAGNVAASAKWARLAVR